MLLVIKKGGDDIKQKNNEGFSLVEVLVAIVLLGALVVPTCTGLVLSIRLNEKAKDMMQAQLIVSSAVEKLMANGIEKASEQYDVEDGVDLFPGVTVKTEKQQNSDPFYKVTVTDDQKLVTVETIIREAEGGS